MWDWIFLFLTISLCLASRLLLSKLSNTSKEKQSLPPGPRYIPILSPILFLRRSFFDFESIIRSLCAKYGPILTLRVTSRPSIFIANRDLAHQALVQADATFADRIVATEASHLLNSNRHNISSAPYGPLWHLLHRNLAAKILHPSRVKFFAPSHCWVLDMVNLVKYQEIQAKLLEEIERVVGSEGEEIKEEDLQKKPYLKAVIMEGLRRHQPGHFVQPHTVMEDIC